MNTGKHSTVNTPQGSFHLERYPARRGDQKQAWNAADLLLLEFAAQAGTSAADTLVVNDEFGAIALALGSECVVWSDSALTASALLHNAGLNTLEAPRLLPATAVPRGRWKLVLLRIPKNLSLLRYQLQSLRDSLPAGCLVVCGGMDKHLPRGVADTIEAFLGPTERHRGQRKARLFSAQLDKTRQASEPPQQQFFCPELGQELISRPNVFSAAQLDIGTRLLLQHMDKAPRAERVADLGCGNGVIGLAVLTHNPQASVDFIDESALAIASAGDNVQALFPRRHAACTFHWADGFTNYSGPEPGLILCNPPFHQQHVVDDFAGRRLLEQSADVMRGGGELWVVANRHLPYGKTLRSRFAVVERLAENAKFIVWRAVKG